MDNSEILQKLENIEILLASNIESMNDPRKRAKEAEILIQASKELNSTSSEITGLVAQERQLIECFKPTVEHRHYTINMKNPITWVLSCVIISVVAIIIAVWFHLENKQLKAKNAELSITDMKYRYLKLSNYNMKTFSTHFKNTEEMIDGLDTYYSDDKNKKFVDSLVIAKERAVKEANEASELAKRNQETADELVKMAKQLTHKSDSLKNK